MRSTGVLRGGDRAVAGCRASPSKAEVKNPTDELQGGWSMVLLFVNGEETPVEQAKSGELVIEDDVYRSKLGATAETSTFKVDATKNPKEIDFTYTSGFLKGKTVKGIYKIDGDDLTICRGLSPETDRPDEFAAPADSGLLLVIWKRSKTVGAAQNEGHPGRAQAIRGDLEIRFDRSRGKVGSRRAVRGRQVDLEGRSEFTSTVQGNTTHGTFKIDPTASPRRSTSRSPTARARTTPRKASTSLTETPRRSAGQRRGNPARPSSRPSPRAAGCSRFSRK